MVSRLIKGMMVIFLALLASRASAETGWKRLDSGLNIKDIRRGVTDIRSYGYIWLLASSGLYRVDVTKPDSSSSRLFNKGVNDILIFRSDIFLAEDNGLYRSKDGGQTWHEEFHGVEVFDLELGDDKLYMATRNGLYSREYSGVVWNRMAGEVGRKVVVRLMANESGIYALTKHELFFIPSGSPVAQKIYSISTLGSPDEEMSEIGEAALDDDDNARLVEIAFGNGTLYLATSERILVSPDSGASWREYIPGQSIPGILTTFLSLRGDDGQEKICFGSDKGVSCGDGQVLTVLNEGLASLSIRSLSVWDGHGLIAVTDEGVFLMKDIAWVFSSGTTDARKCSYGDYSDIVARLSHEPTIHAVQARAVDYAEANKNKIDTWRKQAKVKALLPTVSVGVDRTSGELLHWDTGANPDALQKGRSSADWDLRLTWQLSDLIWSSDQTSIDARSKMMVELREQVVDQVTRIYYERRRLQIELASCEFANSAERLTLEMRIDELSALLNGYTGGTFSRGLSQDSFNHQTRRDNL